MSILKKVAVFFTALFSASTVICGVSIAQKAVLEQSSVNFHMGLAVLTILSSFGTIALFARANKKA
jgi:hypothetical protein